MEEIMKFLISSNRILLMEFTFFAHFYMFNLNRVSSVQ